MCTVSSELQQYMLEMGGGLQYSLWREVLLLLCTDWHCPASSEGLTAVQFVYSYYCVQIGTLLPPARGTAVQFMYSYHSAHIGTFLPARGCLQYSLCTP